MVLQKINMGKLHFLQIFMTYLYWVGMFIRINNTHETKYMPWKTDYCQFINLTSLIFQITIICANNSTIIFEDLLLDIA